MKIHRNKPNKWGAAFATANSALALYGLYRIVLIPGIRAALASDPAGILFVLFFAGLIAWSVFFYGKALLADDSQAVRGPLAFAVAYFVLFFVILQLVWQGVD